MKVLKPNSRYVYPNDNSYSICLNDGTKPYPGLAGNYNTPAKKVLVISQPYKKTVTSEHLRNECEHEFVNVLYEGKKYRVLNNLRDAL